MNKLIAITAITIATTTIAHARESSFNVGVSSFATVLQNNIVGGEDEELTGLGIYLSGAFSNNFGLKGLIGFQQHDAVEIDVVASEITLQAGTGLSQPGFKAYGSIGIYGETWESWANEESFSGGLFGGGVGYNWSPVAVDLWVHLRGTSDYEDLFGPNSGVEISAASAGLGIAGRF